MKGLLAVVLVLGGCVPPLAPGQSAAFPAADPDLEAGNRALGDPHGGRFSFEDATAGLPPNGALVATLQTDAGDIVCTLDPGHAPLAVANFVGLARGLRPFRDEDGTWVSKPYYDGVPWHRAITGQFVQTGRRGILADGGFLLQDEIAVGDDFSRPGVLAMAGTGESDTSSVQFFITTAAAKQLEGAHTIVGTCENEAVTRQLERAVLAGEHPMLRSITIDRG